MKQEFEFDVEGHTIVKEMPSEEEEMDDAETTGDIGTRYLNTITSNDVTRGAMVITAIVFIIEAIWLLSRAGL